MIRYVLISLLWLLLAAPFAGLAWLGVSEAGLRWAFELLQQKVDGGLQATHVQGRLIGPIEVRNVAFRNADFSLSGKRLSLRWSAEKLLVGQLQIDALDLGEVSVHMPLKEAEAKQEISLPKIDLPLAVAVDNLTIADLVIQQGDQRHAIDRASASFEVGPQGIEITRAQVISEQIQFKLAGEISSKSGLQHSLTTDWLLRLDSGDELAGTGTLVGNLEATRLRQSLQRPSRVSVDGVVSGLLRDPAWRASVQVEDFRAADWRFELPEFQAALQFDGEGDLDTIHVRGTGEITRPDTGRVLSEYDLKLEAFEQVQITQLKLQPAVAGSVLHASGQWRAGDGLGQADLELDWRNLRWPLSGKAAVASKNGQGRVRGDPSNFRFELETSEPVPGLPPSTWIARGSGTPDKLLFDQLQIEILDGVIDANGTLNLGEALSWQASIGGKRLDPAGVHPDWPGRLDFTADLSGSLVDREISTQVDVRRLNGVLREFPVKLAANFDWRRRQQIQEIDLHRLAFTSGSSALNASGRIGEQIRLDWSLQSSNLGELFPQAQGSLDANGQLQGTFQQPRVVARVKGQELGYESYQAAGLEGTVTFDPLDLQKTRVDLQANALLLNQRQVDRLSLSGDADRLLIQADAGDLGANIELVGAAQGDLWQGQLVKADLTLGPLKQWRLRQPAGLQLQQQSISLERSCWQGGEHALVCSAFNGGLNRWSAQADLDGFMPQQLQAWLPPDLVVDASAAARARLRYQDQQLTGNAHLTLSEGEVRYPLRDGEIEQWAFRSAVVELKVDAAGIRTDTRLELENSGQLQAKVSLPGAALPNLDTARQRINGVVTMNLEDLGFVGLWLPEVHQVRGRFETNLQIDGTLSSPNLNGQVTLADGSLSIPRLGLDIREVTFSAKNQGMNRLEYRLSALSGEGQLQVSGEAWHDKDTGWASRLTLRGQEVEVARIPEAQIQASPNLVIEVRPYQVEVSGEILIPYAHIEPRDFSTATRVSNDVVILGEEQTAVQRWKILSRVRLLLGERVHFFGYGFEGRLGGEVLIEDMPGQPTRANGEINVADGRYRAYGQRLDISLGRLIFSGGPLSVPGLDITAQRQVNTITVGIRASGTVLEPRIELFSSPAMGQTDILSYLILGRPLENASSEEGQTMAKAALALGLSGGDRIARNLRDRFGLDEMRIESSDSGDQASLVIGRYLTPRLYVSYGIGLIEAFNTLILRYQVSDRWQLKAESGESHGADLIFTIER